MAGPGDNSRAKTRTGGDGELVKRAIATCVRAIAGDAQMEVSFAKDKPALAGSRARLPDLPR